MTYGKSICKQLKDIRRSIADENGIPLEIPECTYQGECSGTCPQCEKEVRYLENELARRLTLGKAATVAGIAVTLASPAAAQVDNPTPQKSTCTAPDSSQTRLHEGPMQGVIPPTAETPRNTAQVSTDHIIIGTLIDADSQEPIPFANVVVKQYDKVVTGTQTNFDGEFKIKNIPLVDNSLTITIICVGYNKQELKFDHPQKKLDPGTVNIKPSCVLSEGIVVIEGCTAPLIDPSSGGQEQVMEIEGVTVRVQY